MTVLNHEKEARTRLKKSGGRVTSARVGVLSLLLDTQSALTHQELEQSAQHQGLSFDRVTLYRALDWLVAQGIAHKIAGIDRSWRYNALRGEDIQQHAHFHCKKCDQVFCLEKLQPTLLYTLPTGYQIDEIELNLQGQCPDCHAEKDT